MRNFVSRLLKNKNGYIVVETVGTFIPFTLLVISILSLVNIITLQARIHNALTQAANTLSMYSYVLYATGAADDLVSLDNKASVAAEKINPVITGIEALSKGNGFDSSTGDNFKNAAVSIFNDPKTAIQNILTYGAGGLRNQASIQLVQPLVEKFLATGDITADEYLKSVRVKNFSLGECVIIDKNENVKITAEYEVEYTFGALKLPFGPTLKITQTVVTKAWLGGSGEGYGK